jgi:hypothetical protein
MAEDVPELVLAAPCRSTTPPGLGGDDVVALGVAIEPGAQPELVPAAVAGVPAFPIEPAGQ